MRLVAWLGVVPCDVHFGIAGLLLPVWGRL